MHELQSQETSCCQEDPTFGSEIKNNPKNHLLILKEVITDLCRWRWTAGIFFFFQVSDMENILGIVQTENIIVSAEAYNIDVEITPGSILAL